MQKIKASVKNVSLLRGSIAYLMMS